MPNLWKRFLKSEQDGPKIEDYHFAAAEELVLDPEEDPDGQAPEPQEEENEPVSDELKDTDPLGYARVQGDMILREAKKQAEEIRTQAEEQAEQSLEAIREEARESGYQAGFQEGLTRGMAQALEKGAEAREAQAEKLEADVAEFLRKAEQALDRQLDENVDELRDLAIAVAEKVVCVSLKSSSEVIGRMIQTAVDKRKRREWVHIYIAECDAKNLTSMPASLSAALSELSDRVRIIPMADDEPGTCIIESPDEIIDASAATQLQNIRELLSNGSGGGLLTNFNYSGGGPSNRVPTNDPPGLQRENV